MVWISGGRPSFLSLPMTAMLSGVRQTRPSRTSNWPAARTSPRPGMSSWIGRLSSGELAPKASLSFSVSLSLRRGRSATGATPWFSKWYTSGSGGRPSIRPT
ncbi:MAG: hypothetical protein U0797_24295 [Gemmataceae bacterium]